VVTAVTPPSLSPNLSRLSGIHGMGGGWSTWDRAGQPPPFVPNTSFLWGDGGVCGGEGGEESRVLRAWVQRNINSVTHLSYPYVPLKDDTIY
jgi:hypothetical protein